MGARSRTGEPGAPPPAPRVHAPRTRTQHPTPTRCPETPAQSEDAHAAPAGRHPSSRPASFDPCLAAASGPGHTHRSGRAVRAQLRSGASSPARLRSASRFGSSSRSTGLGSEMVAAAARREGVCARARARLCAGESPRSPARPLLPPALHAAMPAESLTRAPTLRGAHTRARVHPFAAPPAPHAPLALLGRPQRAQNAARGAR